jgi:hypothetical protein
VSGLADALARHAEPPRKGPRCTVGQLLTDLDDENRLTLVKALADPANVSPRMLEDAVSEEYERLIRKDTWRRHRNGECACGSSS